MKALYCQTKGKELANGDDDGQVALSGFNGKYNHCGEYGYGKFECPNKGKVNNNCSQRNGGGQKKFKGNCNHCGKKGHKKWIVGIKKATVTSIQRTGNRVVSKAMQPLMIVVAV